MRAKAAILVSVAGLTTAGTVSSAGPIEVIYCKKAGHPKAVLPGAVDLSGNPEVTEWRGIEQLSVAPDGLTWFIQARSQAAADHDLSIVKGSGAVGAVMVCPISGTSPPVSVTFEEGRPAPFHAGSSNQDPLTWDWFDFFPSGSIPKFDTAGNAVLGVRARTTQTGAAVSTDAARVLRWNRATNEVSLGFKQTDLYTGLVENPTSGPAGDEAVGNSVGSVHLLDNGAIGSHDGNVSNLYSLLRPVLTYNLAGFHQVSTRTPNPDILTTSVSAGSFGTAGERYYWAALDSGEFYTTPDGAHHYIEGRILDAAATADGVLAVGTPTDGTVVLREGSDIPGSSPTISVGDIFQTSMAANGDWYSRGRNVASTAVWFVKNGVVIARTGDPITPGNTETWAGTFLSFAANSHGDWVLIGRTSNPDASQDDVVVLNGTEVVMRENDPVDLDGNGQFDDDAFIGQGPNTGGAFDANNHWYLTEGRVLYGILNLRNGAGVNLASNPAFTTPSAFVRKSLGAPVCYANCDASTASPVLNVQDFSCFLQKYASGDAYANCDGSTAAPALNVQDFSCFLQKYAAGCP